MTQPKQQHGNHTWDMILHYHRCPNCGYIIECRKKYDQIFRVIQKELNCPRCNKTFNVLKQTKPTFGPLLGHDPEIM